MYRNSVDLLRAVQARKAKDAVKQEENKKLEEIKPIKKIKRQNTKEYLVEEAEQPKNEVVEVNEPQNVEEIKLEENHIEENEIKVEE